MFFPRSSQLFFQTLIIICILFSTAFVQAAQVTLAWDSNDPVPDGYRVYYRTEGGHYDYSAPVWPQQSDDSTLTTCTIDNLSADTTYSFVVRAFVENEESGDSNEISYHTPAATITSYTISAGSGPNGSVYPGSATVNQGESQTFSFTADDGYAIADVQVDGVSVGPVSSYTFSSVSSDHAIHAFFTVNTFFSVDTYTITASAGPGGTISPIGQVTVQSGSSQTFAITADNGYAIASLTVDGVSAEIANSYTFTQINAAHRLSATFAPANKAPVADAGPDQVVDEAATVTLSGLNSYDPDDGIAIFQWRQIQGQMVTLSSNNEEMVTFLAPDVDVEGEALVFELTVIDTHGETVTDTCIVNVSWVNEAPTANAGTDQSISEGSSVTLSAGGSTDPDDGIAQYTWLQLQGPSVVLSDPSAANPGFTAPEVGLEGASLVFQLTVTDAGGLQDTDTCSVTVTWDNREPIADAGFDIQVFAGEEVVLDGSHSTDPDGLPLLYQWHQTDGSPVVLSDPTAVQPVFTVPQEGFENTVLVFELTVTDQGGLKSVDTCNVVVDARQQMSDTTAPVLNITDPENEYIAVSSGRITISGTAFDDQQVDRIVWTDDRGKSGVAIGTTQWVIEALRLHRWQNTITITAYDTTGNYQSKSIVVDVSVKR